MSGGSGVNKRFCLACRISFSVHVAAATKRWFCPNCGECADVVRYDSPERYAAENKRQNKHWTVKEVAELARLVEKGKRPFELAARFNRSGISVYCKTRELGYKFNKEASRWEKT